ncbi:MAG: T9SS type A sorting domain-containing protein [Thermoanaerobaculia bacterium]|nr:T9SS type A sorting domain-containing protein [Thermoanaerobaculia bacterium]
MHKILFFCLLSCLAIARAINAQTPFSIKLDPVIIAGAPGLHSYASGEWQGEWLLLCGREDGLHRQQPFAAFDKANQNDSVYVINPETKQVWSAPLSGLSPAIAEQLKSTNPQFAQRDSMLYITGGYGLSPTAGTHITYPQLLAVDIPGMIAAIRQGTALEAHIRVVSDERMAVTGGQMAFLEGRFFLAGGHRFDGPYNHMDHPTFVQEYTNQIRIFHIADNGNSLAIEDYSTWTDTQHLHRRDYNLTPAIFPDGHPGLTIFSGVFQYSDDLPWLYPVDIDTTGYTPQPGFTQYLNHYHCASMVLFDDLNKTQHTVFFGGMAQYTLDAAGTLVQDIRVPFVKTIARVTRLADGTLEEVKLPVEMPALLGSGAEFFPHHDIPLFPNGVIRLNDLPGDSLTLGYIYGGIRSPQPNIFFTNFSGEAVSTLYRVTFIKNTVGVGDQTVSNPLRLLVSPGPANGSLQIKYWLPDAAEVQIRIYDTSGRLIGEFDEGRRFAGEHWLKTQLAGMPKGLLLVNLLAGEIQVTQKVLPR